MRDADPRGRGVAERAVPGGRFRAGLLLALGSLLLAGCELCITCYDGPVGRGGHGGGGGGGGGGGHHSPRCTSSRTRSDLERPVDGPYVRARGRIRLRVKTCGESRLSLLVKGAAPGKPLEVFVSLPSYESGDFRFLATLEIDAHGRGRFDGWGEFLETDAASVYEVRTLAGTAILRGSPPDWRRRRSKAGLLAESRAVEDPGGEMRAAVDYLSDPETGRERLTMEFAGLPPRARLDLFLAGEGKDRGLAEPVLTRRASAEGVVLARFDTRDGPGLPRGARRVRDLWHRGFRVQVDGETVLEGVVPSIGSAAEPVPGVDAPGGG